MPSAPQSPLNHHHLETLPMLTDELQEILTARESQVLELLAEGLTNKEIGVRLGISYETVKEHVQNLLKKIGVSDRTKAAVWLLRQRPTDEAKAVLNQLRLHHVEAIDRIDQSIEFMDQGRKPAAGRSFSRRTAKRPTRRKVSA